MRARLAHNPLAVVATIGVLATLALPPWRYHLSITKVEPRLITLSGSDVSEIAPAWRPPSHEHYLGSASGIGLAMTSVRVDWGRLGLWWTCVALATGRLAVRRRTNPRPTRALILAVSAAALLSVGADRLFVLGIRPQLDDWQFERAASLLLSS